MNKNLHGDLSKSKTVKNKLLFPIFFLISAVNSEIVSLMSS